MNRKTVALVASISMNAILLVISAPTIGSFVVERTPIEGTYSRNLLGDMPVNDGAVTIPGAVETVEISGRNVRVESKVGSTVSSATTGRIVARTGSTIQVHFGDSQIDRVMHVATRWPWDAPLGSARTYKRLE